MDHFAVHLKLTQYCKSTTIKNFFLKIKLGEFLVLSLSGRAVADPKGFREGCPSTQNTQDSP